MTAELAVVRGTSSDLTIRDDQTFWSDKQIAALHQLGVQQASNGDLAVFFHQCTRTGLDPFAKQIYMIGRWSREGTKYTIQTGIDGYRLIARRVVDARGETLEYEDNLWCGPDGQWVDVWLATDPPAAAKVTVLRNGKRFSAIALWREYVQTVRDKQTGADKPNSMWERMGSGQLAKCAEALALRKAFPQDLSGIYTSEEMGQADNPAAVEGPQAAPPPRTAADRVRAGMRPAQQPPAPAPEPEPARPVEGEVVDAEIVTEPTEPAATRPQLTAINAALGVLFGFTDREDKLAYLSGELGRDIASSAELTKAEASRLIDKLTRAQAEEDAAAEQLAAEPVAP